MLPNEFQFYYKNDKGMLFTAKREDEGYKVTWEDMDISVDVPKYLLVDVRRLVSDGIWNIVNTVTKNSNINKKIEEVKVSLSKIKTKGSKLESELIDLKDRETTLIRQLTTLEEARKIMETLDSPIAINP